MGYMIDLGGDKPQETVVLRTNEEGRVIAAFGPFESEDAARDAMPNISSVTHSLNSLEAVTLHRVLTKPSQTRQVSVGRGKRTGSQTADKS
jgi:hypothetical protein